MLANYLIGLREGLEAALIVVILVAYIGKVGRRDVLGRIWLGVWAAIILSIAVAAVITFGSQTLTFRAQEILEGCLSVVAVVFVTWMIFWMAEAGRKMGAELRDSVDAKIGGAGWGLVGLAFVSVAREGLETALIIVPSATAYGLQDVRPFIAAGLGILSAVLLGFLMQRGMLRINLTRFFTVTGVFLIFIAGGILSYGVHSLQEANLLPGLNSFAFQIGDVIRPDSWVGTLLGGIFNFTPETTWLSAIAWTLYVGITLTVFIVGALRRRQASVSASTPSAATAAG
ncbi:FTR1 family protein [Saxibacter everestensis]|uniref:FTR1 family protein n=1 Tax=Saxibacter everestensis TaxID=2909229 RepID=A0ABY8QVH5_9MICO|nr:FTR1 family protein [Brevibacteriaceae bacterium ZFBP1038]